MTQLPSLKLVWRKTLPSLFSFLLAFVAASYLSAQEYPKLILPGDYPDPSIMRDGDDYYMGILLSTRGTALGGRRESRLQPFQLSQQDSVRARGEFTLYNGLM